MSKYPLKLRELLKVLKSYGIIVKIKGGKGSEIILLKPNTPGSNKGPTYPVKNHGMGTEIAYQVIA